MKELHMKVGARLGLGFALVLVLLLSISMLGIWRLSQVQSRLQNIVNVNVFKMQKLQTMSDSVHIAPRVPSYC